MLARTKIGKILVLIAAILGLGKMTELHLNAQIRKNTFCSTPNYKPSKVADTFEERTKMFVSPKKSEKIVV